MHTLFSKDVLTHPFVLGALAIAGIMIGGSAWYYAASTRMPQNVPALADIAAAGAVRASGTVEPAQNPNLVFQTGGHVSRVATAVGSTVARGQLLAQLDTTVLQAQRAQYAAALQAQEAKLEQIKAPARLVDVSAKQTGVDQAQTTLANAYTTAYTAIEQAYDTAFSDTAADTDNLFNNPNSTLNPSLVFDTSNSSAATAATSDRIEAKTELSTWANENAALTAATPDELDQALVTSIAHLRVLRTYGDALLNALSSAIPTGTFSAADVASAQTDVGSYRDAINGKVTALQTAQQTIAAAKLGVQSARDALNQTLAGATQEDINTQEAQVKAAQASVASVDAQIALATIYAPYAGTVGSVQIKVGDTVSPNTTAITLNPTSALQITAFVSESDAGKLSAGNAADVTLDAYGSDRHFPATVVSVDRSPTMQQGVPAYKVVLQFNQNDAAISSGMTANVVLTPTH